MYLLLLTGSVRSRIFSFYLYNDICTLFSPKFHWPERAGNMKILKIYQSYSQSFHWKVALNLRKIFAEKFVLIFPYIFKNFKMKFWQNFNDFSEAKTLPEIRGTKFEKISPRFVSNNLQICFQRSWIRIFYVSCFSHATFLFFLRGL